MSRRPLAAITAVLLAGCGHRAAVRIVALPHGGHANGNNLRVAVRHLCDATNEARHDTARAGSAFYLRSHTELHTLAAALGLADRARFARLLEAMYTVEQDIAAASPRSQLASAADWLYHNGDLNEPWVFVIGADGRLAARFDNVTTRDELEPLLRQLPVIGPAT